MSKEKQRQLAEINRPMNEELFNSIEKQYKEIARVKAESEQIEEIRKDIFNAFGGYAKWEEDWQSLAEAVYSAGYRKQSKGEWEIVKGSNGQEKMVCTNCRHGQDLHSTFTYCPNCGARMKGESK